VLAFAFAAIARLLAKRGRTSRGYLLDYYVPMGDAMADMIAGNVHRSGDAIADAVEAYAAVGVDELILDPTVADPEQVGLVSDVVFGW
jgi:hypothetical protein